MGLLKVPLEAGVVVMETVSSERGGRRDANGLKSKALVENERSTLQVRD